jgi:hypothetical protein
VGEVFLADDVRLFAAFVCVDIRDLAELCPREAGLDKFLRDFLDIRLPFVAFTGSIIAILKDFAPQAGINSAAGQVLWPRSMLTVNSTQPPLDR